MDEEEARARRGSGKAPVGAAPNRVIALEHQGGGRRSVYVPVKRRAKRFLEALAESGNVSLACDVAGLRKDRAYRLRKEDAGFADGWAQAKARFEARAEAREETLDEERLRRDGLVVRAGRDGRVQVSKAHKRAWGVRHDRAFFAAFAESGNISAAARAAGFSYQAAWARARASAAFAERLLEARAEAVERLEWGLIEEGEKQLGLGAEGAEGAVGTGAPAMPRAGASNPDLAKWLVTRADRHKAGVPNRGAAQLQPCSPDEVNDAILKKLAVLNRRIVKERLAQGWTRTPEGHWVPPGYGPAQGPDAKEG